MYFVFWCHTTIWCSPHRFRKWFLGNDKLVLSNSFIISTTALSQACLAAICEAVGQSEPSLKSGFARLRADATARARLLHCCLSSPTSLLRDIGLLRNDVG